MVIIVGISGASGAIYGIRILEILSEMSNVETHLVVSKAGEVTIRHETEYSLSQVCQMADEVHRTGDIGAKLASGSFKVDGMVIAPCSMKTVSAIAQSYSDNLLTRAADVMLKERRLLVLLARETPLHKGHLQNLLRIVDMGGIVLPPVPAFYHKPKTLQELIDHTVGKVFGILGIEHRFFSPWQGLTTKV